MGQPYFLAPVGSDTGGKISKWFTLQRHRVATLTGLAHSPSPKTMDAGGSYNAHSLYSALRHPIEAHVGCTVYGSPIVGARTSRLESRSHW